LLRKQQKTLGGFSAAPCIVYYTQIGSANFIKIRSRTIAK